MSLPALQRKQFVGLAEACLLRNRGTLTHVQATANYTIYWHGSQKMALYAKQLNRLCERTDWLVRVHRSYAVDPSKVQSATYYRRHEPAELTMQTECKIPISRRYWHRLRPLLVAQGIPLTKIIPY